MKRIVLWMVMVVISVFLVSCAEDNTYSESEKRIYIVMDAGDKSPSKRAVNAFENTYKRAPHIVAWDVDWEWPLPKKDIQGWLSSRTLSLIHWQLDAYDEEPALFRQSVNDGDWDDYIDAWADDVKACEYTVLIYVDTYKDLLPYIKQRFELNRVSNVLWLDHAPLLSEQLDWDDVTLVTVGQDAMQYDFSPPLFHANIDYIRRQLNKDR